MKKNNPFPHLISIDPGLSGTGWARWSNTQLEAVGVIHDRAKDDTLAARCRGIASQILKHIHRFGDMHVFIEMPQHMASAKGIAAQSGSVYKLAFLVGYLAADVYPCEVIVVTPQEWKGQLPKDVVQRRIERILGRSKCRAVGIRSHAWDAVGIGLFALGKF